MGAVWLALRILLWVLAALLALLVLALFVPLGVQLCWQNGDFILDARAGFLRLRLYPRKKGFALPGFDKIWAFCKKLFLVVRSVFRAILAVLRLPRRLLRKKRPKRPKSAPPAGAPPAAATPPKPPKGGEGASLPRIEWSLGLIARLAGLAGGLLRRMLAGVRVSGIRLRLPVHGPDAAATALQYGRLNAALHTANAALSNLMRLEWEELALTPDFTGEAKGSEYFSCKITTRLFIMVTAGVWAVYQLWRADIF